MIEDTNVGEDGRPMLSYPSMDHKKEQDSTMNTDNRQPGEAGQPMLDFSGPKDNFDISDRSDENQQWAVDELKREFGSNYESALKNARAVLKYADEEYSKSIEKSGLGNYVPLIKSLNKIGRELEQKYKEADQPGSMHAASLKAFRNMAREKINQLVTDIEADYAGKHGGISRW
jgi:glutamyl-tRNA reductase